MTPHTIMILSVMAVVCIIALNGCDTYHDPAWLQSMATGVEYEAHDIVNRNEK